MKTLPQICSWLLVCQLSGWPALLAQPVIIQPHGFGAQQVLGSGVENLRVAPQGAEGVEAQVIIDYSYDGFAGPTALVLPVIGKKGQTGITAWFGSDPVTVGRGKGTITLRVRYFNDEPGVPPVFTSDQVRILFLNQSGTALITAVPFLKTIHWGSLKGQPAQKAEQVVQVDTAGAQKLAREKREAEAKAKLELAAREKVRLQAEADLQARQQSERKARADALARSEELKKAESEAARIALENQRAEDLRLATAREEKRKLLAAQEQARLDEERRAQAAAKAQADDTAATQAKALAEAKAREEAKALADARSLAESRAKEKALAEAKSREVARLTAEAEAKRLADEKRLADARALAEQNARLAAEETAKRAAVAQAEAKAELEAQTVNEEKSRVAAVVKTSPAAKAAPRIEIAQDKKTKVTNVDVVNRSLDRTQMTFGVELEYKDQLTEPMVGVDVLREEDPGVTRFFVSHPTEIGKSRRNFALIPVKFQPAPNTSSAGDFGTDQVVVYLTDKRAQRYNIFPATMLLHWRVPGAEQSSSPLSNGTTVEIEDFKQNDESSGYVSVRYHLLSGQAKLRAQLYDSANPASAAFFQSNTPNIAAGRGLQLIDLQIDSDAKLPSDTVRADTIQIELVDPSGKVIAHSSRKAAMVWTRPK